MRRILIITAVLLLSVFAFHSCDDKKPNNPELENPRYYFPINFEYKWTRVLLNTLCEVSDDSFSISAVGKHTRPEGAGWDLVSSNGGTTFVYYKGDTIFTLDIGSTQLPAKALVGPIKPGTFWRDLRGYEYSIVGLEDVYSEAAGGFYRGCAKVRRTISGEPKKSDIWWAPQVGKVKRTEVNQGGQCVSGDELRRLDKSPEFP